jgi:succinate dehydrogenase/fumarate reductase flavoprotein subunit
MEALLSRCAEEKITALYDAQALGLIMDGDRVAGVRIRREGREIDIEARRAVILATGSFNANEAMVAHNAPLVSDTSLPIGLPYNDGCGILMGQGAGGALEDMDGIIATASLYPPAQLIKGIVVNALGERFVAEDAYHGRLADFVMRQPGQTAYLVLDSEIFAYPENERAGHRLVDGWETVEEMEVGLRLPQGALVATLEAYNRDAREGQDRRLHKHPDWVKPLDKPPYAAFEISFDKSVYAFLTLGGLRTSVHGQVLTSAGEAVPGLYAAGACAAQLTRSGKEYASGLTLGPGSFFGRVAGRHAATAA